MEENENNLNEETQEDTSTEKTENQKVKKQLVDEVEKLRKENETLKAQKDHWREKASKSPDTEVEKKEEKKEDYSYTPQDMKALMDVDEEDWGDLTDYAKFKGISIAEAKKSSVMQATLAEKAEYRKTEAAANTSKNRQTTKVSPEQLLRDLSQGKVPEPGSKEAEELFWARRGGKPSSK